MPRIGEYFGKLFSIEPRERADPVAVLAWPHLFGGVKQPQSIAYWFYRINVYARAAVADRPDGDPGDAARLCAAFVLAFPPRGR